MSTASKKKSVQFALPSRLQQWRESPRRKTASVRAPLDSLFPSRPTEQHTPTGSLSSAEDAASTVELLGLRVPDHGMSVQTDSPDSSPRSTTSTETHVVPENRSVDSDYHSKGSSSDSGSELETQDSAAMRNITCMQCLLSRDLSKRLSIDKKDLERKLAHVQQEAKTLSQTCSSLEATLKSEKAQHEATRRLLEEEQKVKAPYFRTIIPITGNSTPFPPVPAERWTKRTFRKQKGSVKSDSTEKSDTSASSNGTSTVTNTGSTTKNISGTITPTTASRLARYSSPPGSKTLFSNANGDSTRSLPPSRLPSYIHNKHYGSSNSSGRNTGTYDVRSITRPLQTGLITNSNNAMEVLSEEIKALQEERDRLKQQLDSFQGDLQREVQTLRKQNQQLIANYNAERALRKKYYNMVEDMKGRIRVYCRIRCASRIAQEELFEAVDDTTLRVRPPSSDPKDFHFDRVFLPQHNQQEIFEETQSLIQSALDGYNVCIFAYGQTGSGKTYTLSGSNADEGLTPRAFRTIFNLIKENSDKMEFEVTATFLELHNERFIDLLDPSRKLDTVRRDTHGLTYVPGATTLPINSVDDLHRAFDRAQQRRHVAATRMNSHSSRSHQVSTLFISSTNRITGAILRGKLSLVDLAGSERTSKAGLLQNECDNRLKEANCINKSLSALGDVIRALATKQQHVPYRNNKLTLLMQDSIGGSAKTLMFVTVSPDACDVEESLHSLGYATRVKHIRNDVVRSTETKEIAKLKAIIAKLRKDTESSWDEEKQESNQS